MLREIMNLLYSILTLHFVSFIPPTDWRTGRMNCLTQEFSFFPARRCWRDRKEMHSLACPDVDSTVIFDDVCTGLYRGVFRSFIVQVFHTSASREKNKKTKYRGSSLPENIPPLRGSVILYHLLLQTFRPAGTYLECKSTKVCTLANSGGVRCL